jgi:hypothetical protein
MAQVVECLPEFSTTKKKPVDGWKGGEKDG